MRYARPQLRRYLFQPSTATRSQLRSNLLPLASAGRKVDAETRQYATETAQLPELPENCTEGPALTLLELEVYLQHHRPFIIYKQHHRPLGM